MRGGVLRIVDSPAERFPCNTPPSLSGRFTFPRFFAVGCSGCRHHVDTQTRANERTTERERGRGIGLPILACPLVHGTNHTENEPTRCLPGRIMDKGG